MHTECQSLLSHSCLFAILVLLELSSLAVSEEHTVWRANTLAQKTIVLHLFQSNYAVLLKLKSDLANMSIQRNNRSLLAYV